MKVFFPLQVFYPSQAGGTANAVYWLAKGLVKTGIEPTIVSTDIGLSAGTNRNEWITSDAGRIIYVKTLSRHFPLRQTIVALRNVSKADIVHLSSIFFPTCFVMGLAASVLRKRIIWSVHGELAQAALKHSRFRKLPVLWLIKAFMSRRALFHSTSDEETQSIKQTFGNDVSVVQVSNYIEVPPLVERQPDNYLAFVGRLNPIKAVDNLLQALARSQAFLQSDFVLRIAGKGDPTFEANLHALVSRLGLDDKVVFLGQVEGDEKEKLFANAYFTILPSHSENFGLTVLESLAQNTPVLVSRGAPWEQVEKEKVGFWVENSPDELARYIDEILALSETEYAGYRERSRDFVIREFDIERNIGKWTEVYEKLV